MDRLSEDKSLIGIVLFSFIILLCPLWIPGSSAEGVNAGYGTFSTGAPITVPAYRGLEPQLKLVYSSSGGNTFAGVGWSVSTVSVIQRVSASRGYPKFDDTDLFTFDGAEMMACTSQGGTHCTRVQNYRRIIFDHLNNRWYAYGTNGVKATYEPLYPSPDGTIAWFMTRVEDRRGNAVTYTFWADGDPIKAIYPETIQYNGTIITFYREARPDVPYFGMGNHFRQMAYRLKTIDVQVSGQRARAYALNYNSSPTSGRSLLAGITQHGRNAGVGEDGTITPGVPDRQLPPMTFTYQAGSNGRFDTVYHGVGGPGGRDIERQLFGDVNGDGRADLVKYDVGAPDVESQVHTYLATEDGSFTSSYTTVAGPGGEDKGLVHLADINGDGRVDLVKQSEDGQVYAFLALEDGTFNSTHITTGGPGGAGDGYLLLGDLNADGRADLLKYDDSGGVYTFLAKEDGSFESAYATHNGPGGDDKDRVTLANINGDPFPDLIKTDAEKNAYMFFSNGDGTFESTHHALAPSGGQHSASAFADINGDGLTDALNYTYNGNLYIHIAQGNGTFLKLGNLSYSEFDYNTDYFSFSDVNGDGRADLLWGNLDGKVEVHSSNGDGTFTYRHTLQGFKSEDLKSINPIQFADINGDGGADLITCDTTGRVFTYMALPDANGSMFPDLLARYQNGIGGTTRIQYVSSVHWKNNYLPAGLLMPTVLALETDDGRGNASTTNYVYAGGLWSDNEMRFLGFRKVTQIQDAVGNYTETYFHLKEGTQNKPEYTYLWDNQGNLYEYSAYRYQENDTPPYTSVLTELWNYNYGGGDNCLRTLSQFQYDQFANIIESREFGDYDTPGDEKTTIRGYYPNTVDYIHGLPAYENVYAGLGSGGQIVSQSLFYYDSNTSYMAMATLGELTQTRKWNNQTGGYSTIRNQYDAYGNLEVTWDERGNQTAFVFDPHYHVYQTEEHNPKNHITTKSWDYVLGTMLTVTDMGNGTTITHTYDELGRPKTESHSEKGLTTYEYGNYSNPDTHYIIKTVADGSATGLWSETYNDGLGRAYKTVFNGSITQERWFVGTSDRIREETLPYRAGEVVQKRVYTYDAVGRVLTTTNPDGTHGRNVYFNDPDGYPVAATYDETGREKLTWKDAWGRVTAIRDKNGSQYYYTFYEYDVLDNLVRWVDANNNVSTATWDSLGRKLSSCTTDAGCWSYAYYNDGLMKSQTDAKDQTTHYTYDELGRITAKKLPRMRQVSYFYDEAGHGAGHGRLTRMTYPKGSDSFSYDWRGNNSVSKRCIDGNCQTIEKSFDVAGRLESVTYPDEKVTYHYDDEGRLDHIPGYVKNMDWTSDGRLDAVQYENDTTADYGYNAQRRWLTNATITAPDGAPLYDVGYGYSDSGLVKTVSSATDPLANITYAYDGLNRLTEVSGAQTQSYTYDAMGNRIYAHNGSHPAAIAKAADYQYDDNGNMVADGKRSFTWNAQNHLSEVKKGEETVSFAYDPDKNRILKTDPRHTTRYYGSLMEVRDSQLVKYIYAGPILVARRIGGGSKIWYHSDRLGSIQFLTNETGQVVNNYEYASFGQPLEADGTVDNQRGFTGQTEDAEVGLVYMSARYYDPVLGRFISPDSMVPDPGNSQAHNRYAYCYNNPISYVDPSGHAPVAVAWVGVAITVGSKAAMAYQVLAVVGAVMTTVGYLNNDPGLMTIGAVLTGISSVYGIAARNGILVTEFVHVHAWLAGTTAMATSPNSPLTDENKQIISWAYTAFSLYASNRYAGDYLDSLPEPTEAELEAAQMLEDYTSSPRLMAYPPPEDALFMAETFGTDVRTVHDFLTRAYVEAATVPSFAESMQTANFINDFEISGARMLFRIRVANVIGARWHMNVPPMMAGVLSPTGGAVGPGNTSFLSNGILGMHAGNHDAVGLFGSYISPLSPGIMPPSWPISGQVGGVLVQTFRFTAPGNLSY